MKKGFFITGTDTGVGKTIVTATLATALREQGFNVAVMKPVETGCPQADGRLLPQDALCLLKASGCTAPLDLVNPYSFAEPIAPAIAAEFAGATIDISLIQRCYQTLLASHDIVLVEGAGGLLVPITGQLTMLDLALALDVPLLVVARNVLGTINHTCLTVSAARERCTVLGVILNQTVPDDPDDLALLTNEQALRRWCKAPVFCKLPYVSLHHPDALHLLAQSLATDSLLATMDICRGDALCSPADPATMPPVGA